MAARIYEPDALVFGAFDILMDTTGVSTPFTAEELESTTFGNNSWRGSTAGLRSATIEYTGLCDGDPFEVDENLATFLAVDKVFQVPSGGPGGSYITGLGLDISHENGGAVGQLNEFTLSFSVDGKPYLTSLVQNSLGADILAPGSTPVIEFPSASTFRMACSISLVLLTGADISFDVETDDLVGFGSPVSQGILSFTSVGGQILDVATVTPDTFLRVSYSGTFTAARFLITGKIY